MTRQEIIIAKISHIQESLGRLESKQNITFQGFSKDRDIQDIVLLNLQIAIQGCIDIASHIISDNNWGVPGSLSGLFDILAEEKVIKNDTKEIMRSMAGFRNLIVHEYAGLDMQKIYTIYTTRLSDFTDFLKEICIFAKL